MSGTQHLRFLDGIRATAALVVILHHAWLQSWPYTLYPDLRPTGTVALLTGWLAFGKLAVTAFIVISGFCLMLPIVRPGQRKPLDAKTFFLRRCRRILPPYYAAFALALLLDAVVLRPATGTVYDGSFPITAGGLLSHVLLLQNFSHNPYEIAGPLWSIAVEFQIYLFFPLFVAIYRRWGIVATVGFTTAFGYAASMLFARAGLTNTFAHYIAMFGFGMVAAHLAFRMSGEDLRKAGRICYAVIPALALVGLSVHHQLGSNKLLTDALMGLFTACILLLAMAAPQGMVSRALSVRPLVWIGSFSYSLYLVHFSLQQMLWQWVAKPWGLSRPATFLFIATVGTAVIVALAFGFFRLVEEPWLRRSADGRKRAAIADGVVTVQG